MQKKHLKNDSNLAHGYSSESALCLSYEYHHDFQKSLQPCALDEKSLSIGRVNISQHMLHYYGQFLNYCVCFRECFIVYILYYFNNMNIL